MRTAQENGRGCAVRGRIEWAWHWRGWGGTVPYGNIGDFGPACMRPVLELKGDRSTARATKAKPPMQAIEKKKKKNI